MSKQTKKSKLKFHLLVFGSCEATMAYTS
uniref:Uncharacterized protein n=1 Tax=Anguilla anguilla TaxID=7936 RepID=A0A0E9TQV3_ANGAN